MKVVVIGGGVSGMVSAVASAKKGNSVTVLESNKRVCKKLLMTGGGRCNIANANLNQNVYNAPDFVQKCFQKVSYFDYLDFLQYCGIFLSAPDEEGRLYPVTYSASSVCDALRLKADLIGVTVVCDATATKIIRKADGTFVVTASGKNYPADKVIVTVGSPSQAARPILDSLIDKKYITAIYPSLTPLIVSNPIKSLNGQRLKCNVELLADGKTVKDQRGEVQFREFGLSGICVFNLSSFVARQKVVDTTKTDKTSYSLKVDFLPDFELNDLAKILDKRLREGYTLCDVFVGLLSNKAGEFLTKDARGLSPLDLAKKAKNQMFYNASLGDFSLSQVSVGGVNTAFLDDTLTLPNGVTVAGEAIDVDGICGGYNLYFAFVSGIIAGNGNSPAKN